MRVRKFRIGDEAALLKVFYSAVHQIARRDYSPEQIQAWAPPDLDAGIWEARMRGIDLFVVEANGHIIAYADLQANGYLDHFFVSGDHPRQGAGRLLMEGLHERASADGLEALTSGVSRTARSHFLNTSADSGKNIKR